VRPEVSIAMNICITVFWDMGPWGLVDKDQHSEESCCLYLPDNNISKEEWFVILGKDRNQECQ